MLVRWSEPALEDMEGIRDYIANDSTFYAQQFIERVFDVAKNLEKFPELGRIVPEVEETKNVRELIFQGYRIIYLHQPDHVYIVAVMHGSRDLTGIENKPWEVR